MKGEPSNEAWLELQKLIAAKMDEITARGSLNGAGYSEHILEWRVDADGEVTVQRIEPDNYYMVGDRLARVTG